VVKSQELLTAKYISCSICQQFMCLIFQFWVLQGYFLASSRELTRLDSITKAPVIHHFS